METSEKQKNNTISLILITLIFVGGVLGYLYYPELKAYFERKEVAEEATNTIIANENAPASDIRRNEKKSFDKNSESEICYPDSVDCEFSLIYLEVNNKGESQKNADNKVLIFNPKSPQLEFKVNLGLNHSLYQTNADGTFTRDYVAKSFRELVTEENAFLGELDPLAAINADYIDKQNQPQGLNISAGVDYSGEFKDKRSSFSLSKQGEPSIGIVKMPDPGGKNYITVGGNGRFYNNGIFKDICSDLGEYACLESTERSMAAITESGYVILLTNRDGGLLPEQFDQVLSGISEGYSLGVIQEGVLFDGGKSPSMYYDGEFVTEGLGPIGSVLLIYVKESS